MSQELSSTVSPRISSASFWTFSLPMVAVLLSLVLAACEENMRVACSPHAGDDPVADRVLISAIKPDWGTQASTAGAMALQGTPHAPALLLTWRNKLRT